MEVIDARVAVANEILLHACAQIPDRLAVASALALALGRVCQQWKLDPEALLDLVRRVFEQEGASTKEISTWLDAVPK